MNDVFTNEKSAAWHTGYEAAKLHKWQSNKNNGADSIDNPYGKDTYEHTEWSLGFYYYLKISEN